MKPARPSGEALPAEESTDQASTTNASERPDSADLTELYELHHSAVLAYARTCCREPHHADDIAAEAFLRTLQAVRSGHGPSTAWRPYLLTVVRRVAAEWGGSQQRTVLTPDFDTWHELTSRDPDPEQRVLAAEDTDLLVRSFRSLPERWRAVLWHTSIEGGSPQRVAARLGLTPGGVSSLAARAREGLREAYLQAHVEETDNPRCRHYRKMFGQVARRMSARRSHGLSRHLRACQFCAHTFGELQRLNARLHVASMCTPWGTP
ncbi:sigma-70 family RNA polymerase sigma factor [Streptomyces sp. NPDC006733]|uniref:RNA polymerase sigma factor n=1 Tax=Streptomyces sp. NPDC006733 TaxID=3155460 RepID=UPI0033D89F5A